MQMYHRFDVDAVLRSGNYFINEVPAQLFPF